MKADGTDMREGAQVLSDETAAGETTQMLLTIQKPPRGYEVTTTCTPGLRYD